MKKIMLVEDDMNLREIYGARLMAEGYEIVSAQDGEAALAMAVKEKPDLIISDVMMPKISGFDMLDILRSTPETKDTHVVMMTALSQAEDKTRADELGADRYLVKSQVTLEDVARVVHELLGDTPEPVAAAASTAAPTTGTTVNADEPAMAQNPQPAPNPAEEPVTQPVAAQPSEPSTDAQAPEPVAQPVPEPSATPDPVAEPTQVMPAVMPDPAAPTTPTPDPTQQTGPTPVPEPSATPDPVAEPVAQQQPAAQPAPVDLNSATGLASNLAASETQNQAIPSSDERDEIGNQIADAIEGDMSTAPHEEPVKPVDPAPQPAPEPAPAAEPVTDPNPEPPKRASGERVIQPLSNDQPHINEVAANEPDHNHDHPMPGNNVVPTPEQPVVEPTSETSAAPATEPVAPEQAEAQPVSASRPAASPEPVAPQAPAEPDKYTIPGAPAEPEVTDPNSIAL